jgi:repressor LexA
MTEAQRRVYDYVAAFIELEEYPPTVREIGAALGYSSSATVQQHLKILVAKGYLQGAGRTLRLAADRPNLPA